MIVLHLISSSGYFGAENMLVALAGGLTKLGCRAHVAVFRDSRCPHTEVAAYARGQGLPVEIVPCRGRWESRVVARLRQMLKAYGADVLHTHGYKADVLGCAAARGGRTALVATCHNWPDRRPLMRAYAVLDRLLLRKFDDVATASEPLACTLRRWGIPGAHAMPNGVDLQRFQGAPPTVRDLLPSGCDRMVGFVGRMVPEKGGAVLLHAARKVVQARPRTGFVFIGDGPCRAEWETLATRLEISRNVVFAGVREDMPGVYASLDMLVLPSLAEATPMCLLEALASSRPVVGTHVGSVAQVILPGVTGLLVDPGDASGLTSAILRLLADPALARSMAEQGRLHVARHFSAEQTAAAYLAVYQQAIARRTGRCRNLQPA